MRVQPNSTRRDVSVLQSYACLCHDLYVLVKLALDPTRQVMLPGAIHESQ